MRIEAVFLRHGAVVGIPSGYHPVCAAPGYRLYYLWALAPKTGGPRALALHEERRRSLAFAGIEPLDEHEVAAGQERGQPAA